MKNILLCVSGLTPQIITETLYALNIKKKIKIDEIVIITTSRGEDVINGVDKILNEGFPKNKTKEERNYPALKKVLFKYHEIYKKNKFVNPDLKFKVINAREEDLDLYDVRSDKDNILFPNKLIEVFKKYASPEKDNILHCSLSGGRKTMSVDMALAISIFGRENDKLYHVLVDKSFEYSDFFFPETKMQDKLVEISEKPYFRLRPILGEATENKIFGDMNFMDIVKETQEILKKKSVDKLYISLATKMMVYGEFKPINLEPIQIKLYRFLKENSTDGKRVKLTTIVEYIKAETQNAKNKLYGIENIRTLITKLNAKIEKAILDSEIVNLFKISSGGYGTSEVFIAASAKDIDIS